MTAENSITIVIKLVEKAPLRSKIEINTNPREKKKGNNSVKVSQGFFFFFFKKKNTN